MNLQTTGMELASEIVIKASILNMKVCEVPTTLSPDGRGRRPHLRSFHDGWRHLQFLLIYSPAWLFLYPGLILFVLGSLISLVFVFRPRQHRFSIHRFSHFYCHRHIDVFWNQHDLLRNHHTCVRIPVRSSTHRTEIFHALQIYQS